MQKSKLDKILKDHKDWLEGRGGKRADLQGVNLQGADLLGANLQRAYLQGANLRGVDLQGANLQRANLQRADLQGADLQGANLLEANLRGVKLSECQKSSFKIIPELGSFIGYKKVTKNVVLIIEVHKTAKRVNALSSRKCRASKIKVVGVLNGSKKKIASGVWKSPTRKEDAITYKLGKVYSVNNFCDDMTKECAPGIHFFLTYEEAKAYG